MHWFATFSQEKHETSKNYNMICFTSKIGSLISDFTFPNKLLKYQGEIEKIVTAPLTDPATIKEL